MELFLLLGVFLYLAGLIGGLGPEECYHYKELQDENRSWLYQPRVPTGNDTKLRPGWYRIIGPAGNTLKTGYERKYKYGSTPPYFCGSNYPGALLGSHPTQEEGMVQMTVCFRRRWCFFENDNCDCSFTKTIYVRNCGDYFVYWLTAVEHGYRYCTSRATFATTPQAPVECSNYQLLKDKSRRWTSSSVSKCDSPLNGWYRFIQGAGVEIQSNCTLDTKLLPRGRASCGTTFRGWMSQSHPAVEDGRVLRQICFSYNFECKCRFYSSVYVRNCGNYYVYRLNGVPLCDARFCGVVAKKHAANLELRGPLTIPSSYKTFGKRENLCKNYVSLHNSDRLWSNMDPTLSNCDATLYGSYRFGSLTTEFKMKEGCRTNNKLVGIKRCGTEYHGWLVGNNPSEKDGVVQRIVCFSTVEKPCQCELSTIVKIQNCAGFFVYDISAVPKCNARYCMEEIPSKKGALPAAKKKDDSNKLDKGGGKQNSKTSNDGGSARNGGTTLMVMVSSIIALLMVILISMCILILMLCKRSQVALSHSSKMASSTLPPYEAHSRPRMSSYSVSEFSSMKSLDSRRKRDLFRDIDKSFSDLGSRETVDTYQPILKT